MDVASSQSSAAGYYFDFLKTLSTNSKLDLISQLSQSIKNQQPAPGVPLKSLFGAYLSEETAEEIIENIRTSRVSNRKIEPL